MFFKFAERSKVGVYFIFRVLVGLVFVQHGAQKLFGGLGGNQVELFTLFGLAGIIEFFGGLLLIIGLFTRIAAFVAGIEMVFAYFMIHFPQGLAPIVNGGELALLFFASFLLIFAFGPGKFALDGFLKKRKEKREKV